MDWQNFEREFLSSFRSVPRGTLIEDLDLHFEAQISFFFELSPIQDVFRFRARHIGLKAATLLVDEKGELRQELLAPWIRQIENGIFPLGPKREGDALIFDHLLSCLKALEKEKEVWNWIRKFSPPLCHKRAEEVIRETLWPAQIRTVETYHVRRAALAAWLTLLRQTTGSCFATAPSILIQKKPLQFFKDLYEILSIGQLKRVFSGNQYAVPMCPSASSSELGRPVPAKELLSFSPGLIAGLSAAQMLPVDESMMSKAARLHSALQDLESVQTPEQVLRELTLKAVGLTDEEVADEEYLARIQMSPMLAKEGGVFYQRPSARGQKVIDWKKRFKAARLAFQSLTECSLLRVWEYTIASFCDVKTDFAKWNLYVSLGMHPEKKEGVADFLYQRFDLKLQEANEEIHRLQRVYENGVFSVRSLESLLHRAGDAQRYELQAQLTRAIHESQLALDERDRLVKRAEALSKFFSGLLKSYDEKLQEYFQEIFDPSVSGGEEHLFEDSPAGFRLLYKHGRADASTWELIYTEDAYLGALRSFFSSMEDQIEIPPALDKKFLSEITTELIRYTHEAEFLDGAKRRSEEIGRKTPWNYVSGGTMQTLVQAYYSRSEPLHESPFFPKSAIELLRILCKEKKAANLLIHSPTHAFVLHLDLLPEKAEKKAEENMAFAKKWKCSEEIQEHIGHSFSEKLPESQRPLFLHLFRNQATAEKAPQLRARLLETYQAVRGKPDLAGLVDSHLYEQMDLISGDRIKEALGTLLKSVQSREISQAIAQVTQSLMGAYELHQTAKSILLGSAGSPFTQVDWDKKIAELIRQLGLAPPHLIQFADTNWSGWFFAFVANPFTGQTELWRVNRIGTQGYPMNDWKPWLSPGNKTPWVLLPQPSEYN